MSGKGTPPHKAKGPPSTVKDAKRAPVSSKSKLEKKPSEEKRTSVDLAKITPSVSSKSKLEKKPSEEKRTGVDLAKRTPVSSKSKIEKKPSEEKRTSADLAKITPSVSSKSKIEKKPSEEKRTSVDRKQKTEMIAPVAQVMSADEKKTTRVAKCAGDCDAQDPGAILRLTLEKLKIKTVDKSESACKVNDIIHRIMDHMKKNTECFREVKDLRTGSYYENLKISNPDEFDVMLTVPVNRVLVQLFGDDGAFYTVALKRGKHQLNRFVHEEDYTISAFKMLKDFRKEVKACVKSIEGVEVEKKKKGCPAVTLQITGMRTAISLDVVLSLEVQTSWPSFTNDGFLIDGWLGTKEKKKYKWEPYYLVPKYEGKGTVEREGIVAKDAWRISFSHVEKSILKNHGSQKTCCEVGGARCCRKDCLKLLKHLLGLLKEKQPSLSKFCSYHAKTTLLHACCTRTRDSEWEASNLSDCFQLLLEDFERHLKDRKLPNFFIPTQNLLTSIDRKSCEMLARCISEERNNGFPIFK
ncbi:cyclic GMP-AMP synthase [Hypomesus transpacificus]|uniref:cyclic GMP-AMP synthase n=1 Tax=Hypomesus transpacificus TaxID=137520 RepID=UPI001F07C8CF|nr:cyclic GMP-AMP synthase [Hypomesus transpacificus]